MPLLESIRAVYEQFTNAGVIYGDVENMLDHVFYDSKHVMFIDFDTALLGEEGQLVRSVNNADYEDFKNQVLQVS
jgi:predicted Ser/Thr protein kinase